MKPRWYQEEAVDSLYKAANIDGTLNEDPVHPVAAVPTGAGKTLIICMLIDKILSSHPLANILIASHIKEILEQNHNAITEYFSGIEIGLYSAGMGCKKICKITVAGIQSIYNKAELFEDIDIIIIDEAHLVPVKGAGMYRSFLDEMDCIYIGLTATHFRLGTGYIHEGDGAIFNNLAYDLTSFENFNKLIDQGYLTNLISKKTLMKMDMKGISTVGGDYSINQMGDKFDRMSITIEACNEIIKFGKNYKKWLIFAIDIKHAENIAGVLNEKGIPTIAVHSQMTDDRDTAISKFRLGECRAIVNVDILTTGFDVPDIDLIAMLRPTQSPIIHVQTIGRGLRVAPNKDHCLILDFAGNTKQLGPINDVLVKEKGKRKGQAPVRLCPECETYHHISIKVCPVCNYEFPIKEKREKLNSHSTNRDIIRKNNIEPQWYNVTHVGYSIHNKRGMPSSLKVTYKCGQLQTFTEWVCYDHKNFAKAKANAWVNYRLGYKPNNLRELFKVTNQLKKPTSIKIDINEKFPKILDSRF